MCGTPAPVENMKKIIAAFLCAVLASSLCACGAEKLAPGDKKRLVRAMEIYTLTGETITAHDERTKSLPPRYDSRRFALTWNERETLYARIRQRVDEMVAAGLFEEVERLLGAGLSDSCTAMQAIGYKEIAAALAEQFSLTIDGKKLVLDQPIKSFGSYEVKARLGYEVSGTVYVHVIEEK